MSTIHAELHAHFLGKSPTDTVRDVQALAGLSDADAANFVRVSPQTFRRWRSDRLPDMSAVRLLAIRAGYMPWPEWHGWLVRNGRLYAPSNVWADAGFKPGEVAGMPFLYQRIAALEHQIRSLKAVQHERLELEKTRALADMDQGLAVTPHRKFA
jgi:hypothetical protein